MNASKLWTVNDIKAASRAAGWHWFDPGSMRMFGTVVDRKVYHGENGIFFVTKDDDCHGKPGYTVRQFEPAEYRIDTIGELCDYGSLREARLAAKHAAGGKLETTQARFKPVTDLEQFLADCRKHGAPDATSADCASLLRQAASYDREMVKLCNGEIQYSSDGELPAFTRNLGKRIEKLAERVGAVSVKLGGDPRGCVVKLVWPNGETNDFGKEGWCVPIPVKE